MTRETETRVLEYGPAEPRGDAKRRRVLYCVGLPLAAFAIAGGLRWPEAGLVAATGALLVALALPVRD